MRTDKFRPPRSTAELIELMEKAHSRYDGQRLALSICRWLEIRYSAKCLLYDKLKISKLSAWDK